VYILLLAVTYNANEGTKWLKVQVFWDVTLCHCGCSAFILTLKTHAIWTFETGTYFPVTQHHIPEDLNLQQNRCENLKSHDNLIVTAGCESIHLWQLCGSAANCSSAQHLCEWPHDNPTGRLPIWQCCFQVSGQQHWRGVLGVLRKAYKNAYQFHLVSLSLSTCKWLNQPLSGIPSNLLLKSFMKTLCLHSSFGYNWTAVTITF
jgi:hypothetical protein